MNWLQNWADYFHADASLLASKGVKVAATLLLAWLSYRALVLLTHRIEVAADDNDPDTFTEREQRARTLTQLLNNAGGVAISITALLTILNQFIEIAPLLAGVGVAGLAISFGAQNLVRDVIGGFFILLEGQFSIGDVIEVAGVSGMVERMTMRVVMLRDLDGTLHIVPNGNITLVSNKTRNWSRAVLDLAVSYKEDADRVMAVLRALSGELWRDQGWRGRLMAEPEVWGVERLGEHAVLIRLVANTQPGKQWEVSRELRRRIKQRFDAERIEIPLPQRVVHLGPSAAALEVLAAKSGPAAPSR
jgi:small conductance mechanosensitive channel